MFDLRYHVASLAAVFIALVIGILVGVGISSRGVVSNPERSLLNERITELQARLDGATARAAALSRQQSASSTFVSDSYAALMHARLEGKRVALLFVGSISPGLRAQIEKALVDAGAKPLLRVRAVKVPIDPDALAAALADRPAFAAYAGNEEIDKLGAALAKEFVLGKDTRLWDALSNQLVEEQAGREQQAADGVVVVRSARPQEGATSRFLAGLYSGLAGTGPPAVGVESSSAALTAVPAFRRVGLSTVDDVDTSTGRLALVVVLAGGRPGHYGTKDTATDGILPPIEPLPVRLPGA
jgi:hypothetical protein